MMSGPKNVWIAVGLVLAVHAALLAWAAYRHSPVIDEVGHLAAGISHWQLGSFALYRVNPPLVRMLAALPVLCCGARTDWNNYSDAPSARSEFKVGRDFMSANGARSFWLFTIARWACIPLSLLGGYVCFRWAYELYGTMAGLLALTLWCFSPNVLAHGQLITPDVGAASIGLAANYLFWQWLKEPTWSRVLVTGMILGLAELAKMTWLALFALWPLIWLAWQWGRPYVQGWRCLLGEAAQGAAIGAIGILLINVGYGFAGSLTPLREYVFHSRALTGRESLSYGIPGHHARGSASWLGRVPVPLPKDYLLGIDRQKLAFEVGRRSYLRGQWSERGWWYYYLYALAIKVPVGTWLLVMLAAILRCAGRGSGPLGRDELVLLAPAVAVMLLVSAQTGFSRHLRYVLPVFPFIFIWSSQVGKLARSRGWMAPAVVMASLVASVAGSMYVYPHSLCYFNVLVGGPRRGHAHLLGSNIDWGQDLLYLKRWLEQHPEARPLGLAYHGAFDPRVAGIDFQLPSTTGTGAARQEPQQANVCPLQPRWLAVSVSLLRGARCRVPDGCGAYRWLDGSQYRCLQALRPAAMAGYSIYIYDLSRPLVADGNEAPVSAKGTLLDK